jgi:hypothetical protein
MTTLKHIFFSFIFIWIGINVKAQQNKLFKIDDVVSLDMQGDVDSDVIKGAPLKYFVSRVGNATYMVELIDIYSDTHVVDHRPHNDASLKDYYSRVGVGYAKRVIANGLTVIDSSFSTIGKYKTFKISAGVKNVKAIESEFLIIGNKMYSFMYANTINFYDEEKKQFMNSIVVCEDNPGQLTEK